MSARRRLANPTKPRHRQIGPALSFSNTIRRQPSADPVQKHDPGSGYGAKKGLTAEGPLQKGGNIGFKAGRPVRNSVQTSEKISIFYELEVKNKGGHSSLPSRDNAIYRLAAGLV